MIPATPRIRKTFHVGHLAPRSHCLPRAHRGPMTTDPEFAGWFGFEWETCAACGSTVVVRSALRRAA